MQLVIQVVVQSPLRPLHRTLRASSGQRKRSLFEELCDLGSILCCS